MQTEWYSASIFCIMLCLFHSTSILLFHFLQWKILHSLWKKRSRTASQYWSHSKTDEVTTFFIGRGLLTGFVAIDVWNVLFVNCRWSFLFCYLCITLEYCWFVHCCFYSPSGDGHSSLYSSLRFVMCSMYSTELCLVYNGALLHWIW